ncbi:28531_t:CDS:1, partial [Gigaspora margarita]
ITQLFYFEWPINDDYTGYIQAQYLLHIGSVSQFSPFEISKLTTIPVNKPTPNITFKKFMEFFIISSSR